jgi:hypothetical protein
MQNSKCRITKKGRKKVMKDNRYATNAAGVIKAPKKRSDQPKATVTKGNDLRVGKKGK